jgi:hypothetical protein
MPILSQCVQYLSRELREEVYFLVRKGLEYYGIDGLNAIFPALASNRYDTT